MRGAECGVEWLNQSKGIDWKADLTNQNDNMESTLYRRKRRQEEEKESLSFYGNTKGVVHATTEEKLTKVKDLKM